MKKSVELKAPFKKILWGVDALGGDLDVQLQSAKAIASLTAGLETEIQPVCVVSPPDSFLVRKGYGYVFEDDERKVEENMARLEAKSPLRQLSPKIVRQPFFSTNTSVKAMLEFAKKEKADLIVVTTHARTGLDRLFMGSFAETLFLQSKIPVFVVNPTAQVSPKITNILFPTDFSQTSDCIFDRVLALAKPLKAKITLYHYIQYLEESCIPYANIDGALDGTSFQDEDTKARKEKALSLKERAKRENVEIEFLLERGAQPISDVISKAVDSSKAQMIAMASQSGAVSSFILGSTARRVVRESSCPVWILHPEKNAELDLGDAFEEGVEELEANHNVGSSSLR